MDATESNKLKSVIDATESNFRTIESGADIALTLTNALILSIDKFLPLFKDITTIANEILIIYQAAQHNKRICGVLLDRVQAAEAAVKNLQVREKDHPEFFTQENNLALRKFVNIIKKIKEFVEKIHTLGKIKKFILAKSIESTFNEITSDFDGYMITLNFTITIDSKLQTKRDNKALHADIRETNEVNHQTTVQVKQKIDLRK